VDKEFKLKVIAVRVSEKEKDDLTTLAKRNNMSLSEYLRFVGLNSKISAKII